MGRVLQKETKKTTGKILSRKAAKTPKGPRVGKSDDREDPKATKGGEWEF